MAKRFSWGGIRGRGLSLKGDVVLALMTLAIATILLIMMYMIYERNDVKAYVEKNDPTTERTDKIVARTDKIWTSDLLNKSVEPMSPNHEPTVMKYEGKRWADQLRRDAKTVAELKNEFTAKPLPANPNRPLASDIASYLNTADTYVGDMNIAGTYLGGLIQIEMTINEAVQAAGYGTGNISVGAMQQRDAILAAELAKLQKLAPPTEIKAFHDNTVMYLSDFVETEKKLTEAYALGQGLAKMEALSEESENTMETMHDTLKQDLADLKVGKLRYESHSVNKKCQAVRDKVNSLKNKYRF